MNARDRATGPDRRQGLVRLLALIGSAAVIAGCTVLVPGPGTATAPALPTASVAVPVTVWAPSQPAPVQPSQELATTASAPQAATRLPMTWGGLELKGRLVFSSASLQEGNPVPRIQILDLSSGSVSTILISPGLSWIYHMSASAAAQEIVMSYAPAPNYNAPDQQALYGLPLDGSQLPGLVLVPPSLDDLYLQAEWAPDGKYLYYVHSSARPVTADQQYPIYELFRMAYPDGPARRVAQYAFWPRVSPDSKQLVFVSSDPQDGTNRLFVANADGSEPRQVEMRGEETPKIIDAPLFSPDGDSILFSAPSPIKAAEPSWVERLLGIGIAEAHTVPSEWWSVPIAGGTPLQLTHLESPALYASVSPDGKWIASYSGNGLFVMKPDGTQLTTLIPDLGGSAGMVDWLP